MCESAIRNGEWKRASFVLTLILLLSASAEAIISADLVPVNLGYVGGIDPVWGWVFFPVDAPVEDVSLQVIATPLYKAGIPGFYQMSVGSYDVSAYDVGVIPEVGNETGGSPDNRLNWEPVPQPLPNGMQGWRSETGTFQSGQPGYFNQHVGVALQWSQMDWELPIGEYSGRLGLVASYEGGPTSETWVTVYVDRVYKLGDVPFDPLLPAEVGDEGWIFNFSIHDSLTPIYIDPTVAIGYDFFRDSGPNFASVLLPSVGDNHYELWLWNGSSWADSGTDLTGGSPYAFPSGGVDKFRILGIEPSAGLDPLNTTAFVTGLWFTDTGPVSMRQVPITTPVPGAVMLGGLGLSFAGWLLRRQTT
jgi:hypothetical protein